MLFSRQRPPIELVGEARVPIEDVAIHFVIRAKQIPCCSEKRRPRTECAALVDRELAEFLLSLVDA